MNAPYQFDVPKDQSARIQREANEAMIDVASRVARSNDKIAAALEAKTADDKKSKERNDRLRTYEAAKDEVVLAAIFLVSGNGTLNRLRKAIEAFLRAPLP